jgi:hypothetical protein
MNTPPATARRPLPGCPAIAGQGTDIHSWAVRDGGLPKFVQTQAVAAASARIRGGRMILECCR